MSQMRPVLRHDATSALDLLAHQSRQPLFELIQTLAACAQLSARVALIESALEPQQSLHALLQRTLHEARETLLEFIQSLGALTQSYTWMKLGESPIQPDQPLRSLLRRPLQRIRKTPRPSVEMALPFIAIGRYQFRRA